VVELNANLPLTGPITVAKRVRAPFRVDFFRDGVLIPADHSINLMNYLPFLNNYL